MTWNTSNRSRPGVMADATELQQLVINLLEARGQQPGQTKILHGAPVSFFDHIEGSDSAGLDFRKAYSADGGGSAEIDLVSENIDTPSEIPDGATVQLEQAIGQTGTDGQNVAEWEWTRLEEGINRLAVTAQGLVPGPDLIIGPDGFLGTEIGGDPEVEWDGHGAELNVTGALKRNGVDQNDWSLVSGTPDVLEWTNGGGIGNAVVSGKYVSTVADGTAPLVSEYSTTMCPRLDAELLQGFGPHAGLQLGGVFGYGDTPSITQEIQLNRAGAWDPEATASVTYDPADHGKEVTVWLEDDSGTPIGEPVTFTARKVTVGVVEYGAADIFHVFGAYTAAVGTETVRVMIQVEAGGVGSVANVALICTWGGP